MYIPATGDRIRVLTATGDERLLRAAGLGSGVVYVTTEEKYKEACAAGRKERYAEPAHYVIHPQLLRQIGVQQTERRAYKYDRGNPRDRRRVPHVRTFHGAKY